MEITELIWKLFLLLLPGVVATLMIKQIFSGVKYSVFEFSINSALFGIASYIVMELGCSIYNIALSIFSSKIDLAWGLNLSIWDNLFDNSKHYNKIEIIIAYILSIPLGLFYGFIISKKAFNKTFQFLGWTNRYGDNDVWSYYLNSSSINWIIVHDKKSNMSYFGSIRAYSDSNEKREILLNEVDVYASDDWEKPIYQSEFVYLELDNCNFTIESPKTKQNGNENS